MRIAYVCADPGVPVFGAKGSSVHVQEVIRAFARAGAEVDLFATRWGGLPPADLRAVRCHALPPLPKGDPAPRARAALAGNAALEAALERAGPFDLLYERYSLWSEAGIGFARKTGTPGVLEVNAPLVEEQAAHRNLPLPEEAARVAEAVFAGATALIAVSPGVACYLERFAAAQGRIHVIANGVDPHRFASCSPAVRDAGSPFTIGFLGTLKPWHGVSTLIEACARLHAESAARFRLLLVGDGPERARIEADLTTRGLRAMAELTGTVPPAAVPGLLARMDVAAAPYPALPGFYFSPLKIYEYMAAGLPVVASRVGHLERVIQDGSDGLLCPPGDPASLAAALARLQREPELCRRLGAAARERVLRAHTWDAVAARILRAAGSGARQPQEAAA